MPPEMKEAFGFSKGDVVQMLVETVDRMPTTTSSPSRSARSR